MTTRPEEASSDQARRIEEELLDKTGKAHGNPDKPAQEKFDEMGEREEIKRKAGRE